MTVIVLAPASGAGTVALVSALEAGLGPVVVAHDQADAGAALDAHPRAVLVLDLRDADVPLQAATDRLRRERPAVRAAALLDEGEAAPPHCDAVFRSPVYLDEVVRWCARASVSPVAEGLLEDLAAGLCHEIGNPLTSLFLQLELLRDEGDVDVVREHLARIEESARRIQAVVRDVAGAAERQPVARSRSRLSLVVTRARALLVERDAAFDERLRVEVTDAEVAADEGLLAEAVADLAEYLLRAGEGGEPVRLVARPRESAGHLLQLTAAATRLPEDAAGRLFTPLWARQALGLPEGLSLTSARNAFLRHRGDVRAVALADGLLRLEAWLPDGDQGVLPFEAVGGGG